MKRTGRLDTLAQDLAVQLKPSASQEESGNLRTEEIDRAGSEEKFKNTQEDLIKNKHIETVHPTLETVTLNPPHGEKADFERMSITLPPEIRQRLLDESNRRKKERSPDWSISVIVREALAAYLK